MNFSELFIRRPVTTVLVMLGILFFGITAYRRLPVSDLPTVDYPTLTVSASLPGASPETMASAVATPLEKQFSTIAGIDNMTSTSALGSTQHHDPVHARPQHRRRGAGRSGDDRQDAQEPAAGHHSAVVPEGESGRPADPVLRVHVDADADLGARRVRRDVHGAAHLDDSGRGAGERVRRRRSTPCASSSIRTRWRSRQIGIDEVADAINDAERQSADGRAQRPEQDVHGAGERPARRTRRRSAGWS